MLDVTLTFDNGPDPQITPGVLDTLGHHGIKATFFVLGKKIAEPDRRAVCERASAEGHWIGNHTYSHQTPLGRQSGSNVAEEEVGRTQQLIGDLSHPANYFRPFGGGGAIGPHLLSTGVLDFLKAGRFTCVLWNVIPRDWEDGATWPERAMELMQPQNESLVVLHDIPGPQMSQLDRFVGMVRDHGGRFRQQFPGDCVPLLNGKEMMPMTDYVSPAE